MVAAIEEQMHRFLLRLEEKRCQALEVASGKAVKRRAIPRPWTRPNPDAICQDAELLMMVEDYGYVLSDEEFQAYCQRRGVLHVAGEPGSTRWRYFEDFSRTREDYLGDPHFRHAIEVAASRYCYSDSEMEVGWDIIRLGRAKLQDCWELYSRKVGRP